MNMQRRISKAIRDSGKKKAEIARIVGVSTAAVTQWTSRETKSLKAETLMALAAATGKAPQWLATGEGPEEATDQSQMVPLIGTKVPVVDFATIADVLADRNTSPATMAVDWIYPPMKDHGPRTFAFKQPDASMASPGEDSLPAGCFLYVDPDQTSPSHDKPVLARLESGAVLVGHYMNQGGRVWLRMLNPAYPPVSEGFAVLGLVIGLWRDL